VDEARAAATIRDIRRALAERSSSIPAEALAGAAAAEPWRRYPAGEVYDPASHAQYFFHSHPAAKLPAPRRERRRTAAAPVRARAEFGHFHLFLRAEGMPRGLAPLLLPETVIANVPTPPQAAPLRRGRSDRVAHLVAVAVDEAGEPFRLFTTNRWVTGETWYRGEDVARMLDRFAVTRDGPSALLDRWLGALVRIYRDDIAALLGERDAAITDWRWRWRPDRYGSVFEDQRLEITSYRDIDLDARLAEIEQDAAAPPPGAPWPRLPALPWLAEGWGA
jgi:hypothetical protein